MVMTPWGLGRGAVPQVSPEPRFESCEGGRNMEVRRPVVGRRAWRREKLVGSRGRWCREVGSRRRWCREVGSRGE